jgi:prepilin-type processing-associated H-X9-DG protein
LKIHPQKPNSMGWPMSPVAAFTLTELLLVVVLTGALVTIPLSASARVRGSSAAVRCLSNHQRLASACLTFAQDNGGLLPGNRDGGNATTNTDWVAGWMNFADVTDNTNVLNLVNGQLGPYVDRDVRVFRCPADTSTSSNGIVRPRVRSVSMNSYLGQRAAPYTAGYLQFKALPDFVKLKPAEACVFIDERDDSINDGCWWLDMTGYQPTNPAAYNIVDYPACWHDNGANLSFADGHAETWHWQDPRTTPVHRDGKYLELIVPSPNNPDVARLQEASSRPAK